MSSETPDITVTMVASERRSVGVIALISMIRMFGLFALLPVLSLYAIDLEGATPILVGLAVGAYGLTQAGFQIPLGVLSDRIGRLPVIVIGLSIFAIGSVVAATSDSIYGIIAGRLLQGAGAISATLSALITDVTRKEVRTRSMAVFGIGIGLSFMIAMVAGPLIAAKFGVRSLFWIAAALAVVAGLLLKLLPAIPDRKKSDSWNLLPALRPDLLRIDFYVFLLHTIMTATFVALPFLLTRRLGLALTDHWKMYVGALLASLLITVPLIMKDQRQGQGRLMGIAVSLILVGQLSLSFFSFSATPVFVGLVVYFAGFNFLEAALPARLSVMADEELRGASLGVFSSAQFLGAFVGGLVGGRFLGQAGSGDILNVFFACALLAGIWLALQGFGATRKS
jgi:MFS family permease